MRVLDRVVGAFRLGKPGLTLWVVLTAFLGYYLVAAPLKGWILLHLLLGTALTSYAACALNMVMEEHLDARMKRTQGRPLPTQQLSRTTAALAAFVCLVIGAFELFLYVGLWPALLSVLTFFIYVAIYTPLKPMGMLAVWLGAIPGAMPPLMGTSAAEGRLTLSGLSVFLLLFAWQFPHFLSLAYMYREDYARVGIVFVSDDESSVGRQIFLGAVALFFASFLPWMIGPAGLVYLLGALSISFAYLLVSAGGLKTFSRRRALHTFLGSLLIPPSLCLLLLLDRLAKNAQ